MENKFIISPELKLKLLMKLGLDANDVSLLCSCGRSKAFMIMRICRDEFDGSAGRLTKRITPRSLCRYCGTDIRDELSLLQELVSRGRGGEKYAAQ